VFLAGLPPKDAQDQAGTRAPLGHFIRHAEPKAIPNISFKDAEGHAAQLSDWRGRMVLVNLWATWCAPCKTEMPSLDRLQAKLGGEDFAILALSTDRGGPKEPAEFFAREGIAHLKVYNDSSGDATRRLNVPGLPLTAVLNKEGLEIARLVGPADWDSPEIIAQLQALSGREANGRTGARPLP